MERFSISEATGRLEGQEALCIAVMGHLDGSTIQRFEQTLDRVVDGGAKTIVLDFDGLEYISSAGIGVLLGVRESLSQTGGRLQIVNMPSHIRRIFDVLGFSKVITIVDGPVALGPVPRPR